MDECNRLGHICLLPPSVDEPLVGDLGSRPDTSYAENALYITPNMAINASTITNIVITAFHLPSLDIRVTLEYEESMWDSSKK